LLLGCPVRQEIVEATVATAQGDGLDHGVVDRISEFTVDVKGERGELFAEIQGKSMDSVS
jgi:hypothetical protein